MPDARHSDPVTGDAAGPAIEPTIAVLHVADGTPLDGAPSLAAVLPPLAKKDRSREGEELFFLFSPTDPSADHPSRELRDIVRETYWSTPGSVTAALRRTISVANRYLFEYNLNVDRSERCYGGLACAVVRDGDLFLLQAGPAWACALQGEQLRCFPSGERLAHMGIGPIADVRLQHVFVGQGDTLLLAPHRLLRDATEEGLRRALSLSDVNAVAAGLRQVSGDDFAALAIRWESVTEPDAARDESPVSRRPSERPPAQAVVRRREKRGSTGQERPRVANRAPDRRAERSEARTGHQLGAVWEKLRHGLAKGARGGWRGMGLALGGAWRHLSSALSFLWHGVAAAGAGGLALGKWLVGAVGTAIRSTLPGADRAAPRRIPHRPPPEENPTIMTAAAVAIPVVVLVMVLIAYRQFAAESRLQGIINRAEEQIALAQAAEPDSEKARFHWERAMEELEAATAVAPEDASTETLQNQVQNALDELDAIQRLTLTELVDFGSSSRARRLVLTDQALFVLDAAEGWVAEVSLDQSDDVQGEAAVGQDQPVLVRTGQQVEGADVGQLVDCTWLGSEGGRRSSALLVLEDDHQLVSHDPAWRSETGGAQLARVELSPPPSGRAIAAGSYDGRFYILAATPEGSGQIWRYRPEGNAYPTEPEPYFTAGPPESFDTALDMAIDGHIYVLYRDGKVAKFLGGEPQPFEMRGVPKGLGEISGFTVDPAGNGTVYVADRSNSRIVVFEPDGQFKSQLRAWGALGALEALAVSHRQGELYVLDGGRLHAAPLP